MADLELKPTCDKNILKIIDINSNERLRQVLESCKGGRVAQEAACRRALEWAKGVAGDGEEFLSAEEIDKICNMVQSNCALVVASYEGRTEVITETINKQTERTNALLVALPPLGEGTESQLPHQ